MFRRLTSWAGRRAACFVALVYFAGVLAPSVALAFGDGSVTAYCFDEIAGQVAGLQIHSHNHVHVHSDGTVHHHVDNSAAIPGERQPGGGGSGSQGHSHDDGNCCGAFGFTAVLPTLSAAIDQPAAYHLQQPIPTNCLVGCGPDRINRPPIALLPM